jgi:hypothetical protein
MAADLLKAGAPKRGNDVFMVVSDMLGPCPVKLNPSLPPLFFFAASEHMTYVKRPPPDQRGPMVTIQIKA